MTLKGQAKKLLLPTFLVFFAGTLASAEWNQWRGPQRTGEAAGAAWPEDLAGLELVWRIELGKGYPGPIVTEDRVFVVETVDRQTVGVRALGRATGETLWKVTWPGSGSVPFFASANGDWVRSTPAHDGESLFVGDMQERLMALDAATGEVRWKVDFTERFGTRAPDFGFASSPLVDGDALYVQAANSIVKLNKRTGETLWRALENAGAMQASGAFSSPVIATIHGVRQLVVQTRHTLNGVHPETGEVLWEQFVPNFRGMNILTPIVHGNTVFTSPYRERSYLFAIDKTEDGFRVREAWTNPATAYMSSPVLIDGHAYLHLGNRRVDCIDLETGESRWRSESFGKYWSMAWQGDKILALDERGDLYLLRANPETFELLDSRGVSDQETWGHLAVSDDGLFVRELQALAAYRWIRAETETPSPSPSSQP